MCQQPGIYTQHCQCGQWPHRWWFGLFSISLVAKCLQPFQAAAVLGLNSTPDTIPSNNLWSTALKIQLSSSLFSSRENQCPEQFSAGAFHLGSCDFFYFKCVVQQRSGWEVLPHVVLENLNSHVRVVYLQVQSTLQSMTLPLADTLCRFGRIWSIAASEIGQFSFLCFCSPPPIPKNPSSLS